MSEFDYPSPHSKTAVPLGTALILQPGPLFFPLISSLLLSPLRRKVEMRAQALRGERLPSLTTSETLTLSRLPLTLGPLQWPVKSPTGQSILVPEPVLTCLLGLELSPVPGCPSHEQAYHPSMF